MERKFNRVNTARERQFYDVILEKLYDDPHYRASTAWCFSRGDRMIDEYIIDFDDYVGIGSGSVSIVGGRFYVNSFSLDRYDEFLSRDRLPIIGWRELTEREALRYYLLTALFGMAVDADKFERRFGASIAAKLGLEVQALKLLGLVKGTDKIRVTRKGMFPVNIMMRDFFASLNGLRERCIEQQV
jgi:coproporphyrinogen III oxidase-like Fe-S oxidoreductase